MYGKQLWLHQRVLSTSQGFIRPKLTIPNNFMFIWYKANFFMRWNITITSGAKRPQQMKNKAMWRIAVLWKMFGQWQQIYQEMVSIAALKNKVFDLLCFYKCWIHKPSPK